MANEKSSAFSIPQTSPAGPSRRGMLSIIPVALFAGWRGLSMRPKIGSGLAAAALQAPPTASEQPVSMFSYQYIADSAEGEACEICATVHYYDENGRLLDHRVLPPTKCDRKAAE